MNRTLAHDFSVIRAGGIHSRKQAVVMGQWSQATDYKKINLRSALPLSLTVRVMTKIF